MAKSPFWEANSHSASQEIPRPLWNPKFRYSFHKSPPPVSIQIQMNLVHIFPPYFPKIYSDIALPSKLRSSAWSQVYRPKFCMDLCLPRVLHAPPMLSSLIWSPCQYLVKCTSYEAPRYVVFSSLPPLSIRFILLSLCVFGSVFLVIKCMSRNWNYNCLFIYWFMLFLISFRYFFLSCVTCCFLFCFSVCLFCRTWFLYVYPFAPYLFYVTVRSLAYFNNLFSLFFVPSLFSFVTVACFCRTSF
jgi:hypothetical protein